MSENSTTDETASTSRAITPKRVYNTYLLSKPKKVIDRISPSQLGGCHRAHYLKIQHVDPIIEHSVATLANFEMGFVWEQMIKRALDEQGIKYSFQDQWYDPELNMSGSSDFVIGDMDVDAHMWVSKTMRSEWFRYRKVKRKSGTFDPWVEDYRYIIQQGCYLLMAKKQGKKIHQSTLAYVSKDDSYIGDELVVTLSDKLEKEVTKRAKELNKYLKAGLLPPCTCEGWMVGYCDYQNPNTQEPNRKKKMVGTECCPDEETLEEWRAEWKAKQEKELA